MIVTLFKHLIIWFCLNFHYSVAVTECTFNYSSIHSVWKWNQPVIFNFVWWLLNFNDGIYFLATPLPYYQGSSCFKLIFFVFVEGLGYCRFQTTRISWFQGVHHCNAGSSFQHSFLYLYQLICKNSIFIYFGNEQLVSLAQAGNEITSDILKTTGKQNNMFWFSLSMSIWTTNFN